MSGLTGTRLAKTRARVGVAARLGSAEDLVVARREHVEAKLAAYIERTVAAAPPLSDEQRDRLAGLLRSRGQQAVA